MRDDFVNYFTTLKKLLANHQISGTVPMSPSGNRFKLCFPPQLHALRFLHARHERGPSLSLAIFKQPQRGKELACLHPYWLVPTSDIKHSKNP